MERPARGKEGARKGGADAPEGLPLARATSVAPERVVLERGEFATRGDAIFVDCSAKGVAPKPVQPIFQGERIVVQFTRTCQPTFSAAFVAFVEAHYESDAAKNALCGVVQSPERALDWLTMTLGNVRNTFAWSQDERVRGWLARSRLNVFNVLYESEAHLTPGQRAAHNRARSAAPAAAANLQRLMG